MLKCFYPYEYVPDVHAIDYEKLYALGYRGILFDIDNTLVPHGKGSTPEIDALFRRIQSLGLKTVLLSNNNEARILRFLENIESPYVCDGDKPKPDGYEKALRLLDLPRERVVCIGDQIFTDIYGANRCGIPNILVHFIRKPGEKKIGIRRNLEKIVLRCYRMRRSCQHRLGDILVKERG